MSLIDTNAAETQQLKLLMPKPEAARLLQDLILRGREIKAARLRTRSELDIARQEKLLWAQRATELLRQAFETPAVADHFNEWHPEILPDYACLEAFVEAFYAELNQRLQRLKRILKYVENLPEPPGNESVPVRASQAEQTEPLWAILTRWYSRGGT